MAAWDAVAAARTVNTAKKVLRGIRIVLVSESEIEVVVELIVERNKYYIRRTIDRSRGDVRRRRTDRMHTTIASTLGHTSVILLVGAADSFPVIWL
jgi:hypothetical protein